MFHQNTGTNKSAALDWRPNCLLTTLRLQHLQSTRWARCKGHERTRCPTQLPALIAHRRMCAHRRMLPPAGHLVSKIILKHLTPRPAATAQSPILQTCPHIQVVYTPYIASNRPSQPQNPPATAQSPIFHTRPHIQVGYTPYFASNRPSLLQHSPAAAQQQFLSPLPHTQATTRSP